MILGLDFLECFNCLFFCNVIKIMMRWRMVRNTVVTAKKYTVGNVPPPPPKKIPSYSTGAVNQQGQIWNW